MSPTLEVLQALGLLGRPDRTIVQREAHCNLPTH